MLTYDQPFNPPAELRIAGWIIISELLVAFALVGTASRSGVSVPQIQIIAVAINIVACIYLGIAASRLGKSWLLYGFLPAISLLIFVSYYSYYKLRTDAWYKWADEHATYRNDRST